MLHLLWLNPVVGRAGIGGAFTADISAVFDARHV
jgi:hypothetical protein